MSNDRFTFRAWWEKNNTMDYDPYGDEHLCEGTPVNGIFRAWPFRTGDAILMQSTGLRDKNGKLIYENDIVLNKTNNKKMLVEWFRFAYRFDRVWHMCELNSDDIKIIGNIYENPELLERMK